MKKHSLVIMGHQTSVSLEEPFWSALKEIAEKEKVKVCELITKLDMQRSGNLSSAIRIYVLEYLQKQLQKRKKQKKPKENPVNSENSERSCSQPSHQEPDSTQTE